MSWRPSSGPDTAAARQALLARVRRYFDAAGVLAVDTPTLGAAPVSDPNIESLRVTGPTPDGTSPFLQTSPEFFMKRLLADGYPDIYAISRVFRGGEAGSRHQPEFTMIEWYRLGFALDDIIDDTLGLVAACLGRRLADAPAAQRMRYRDAFVAATQLDPSSASIAALAAAADADPALRNSLGDDRRAWLDLLFATRVAQAFASDRLTVITHFPAEQAALARLDPDDPAVALRFEVFCADLELANGYVELTDARELRQRFERDLGDREAQGRDVHPLDERFLAAMQSGMPDCAGVALGFERLHMLDAGTNDIRDVLTFDYGS